MVVATAMIVTWNRRGLLEGALRSALGQVDVDHEVLVVDNGSTDDTSEFLASLDDPRLRVITLDENRGATRARNLAITEARGPWVGFCDDDDRWSPWTLRSHLDAAEAVGAHWAYGGCVFLDAADNVVAGARPPSPDEVMEHSPMRHLVPAGVSGLIWQPGAMADDGLLDPRLEFNDDWDLVLRLCRTGPPACTVRPLVAFRQHEQSHSRHSRSHLHEYRIVEQKSADLRPPGVGIDLSRQFRFWGTEALRAGSRREAAANYWEGLRRGDAGCLLRLLAVPLPSPTLARARRRMLSDEAWMQEGDAWMQDLRATTKVRP